MGYCIGFLPCGIVVVVGWVVGDGVYNVDHVVFEEGAVVVVGGGGGVRRGRRRRKRLRRRRLQNRYPDLWGYNAPYNFVPLDAWQLLFKGNADRAWMYVSPMLCLILASLWPKVFLKFLKATSTDLVRKLPLSAESTSFPG